MEKSFLINFSEEEFKAFLKQTLKEIMEESFHVLKESVPDILDVKQAAQFLHLQITTLYEKTSRKLIPHFKKGNKLYFNREELKVWLNEGKVKTAGEIEGEAVTHLLNNNTKG